MKKGIIELTEQQANVLLELLNISNKTEGLKVAANCLFFAELITKSFEDKKEEEVALTK